MTDPQANTLVTRITQDMRQALKDKNRIKLDELRSLLTRINNAEAISPKEGDGNSEAPRKQLSLSDIHIIIHAELDEIEAALKEVDKTSEYAAELHEKATDIQKYL